MRVGVQRDGRLSVAKRTLHGHNIAAGGNEARREIVPEVMRADSRDPCRLCSALIDTDSTSTICGALDKEHANERRPQAVLA